MNPTKKIGTILHVSKSTGNLILKVENDVQIGDDIFDKNGKRVGIVFDFFGPVNSPYIAVKPRSSEEVTKLVGEKLFLEEKNQKKRKR
ncbi:hypothetical protein JW865_02265 [Candidatus Bathyarchaeota archaeon]|nr:hypothetical protein [Candidatus Bathyarchaeota archaeon]